MLMPSQALDIVIGCIKSIRGDVDVNSGKTLAEVGITQPLVNSLNTCIMCSVQQLQHQIDAVHLGTVGPSSKVGDVAAIVRAKAVARPARVVGPETTLPGAAASKTAERKADPPGEAQP